MGPECRPGRCLHHDWDHRESNGSWWMEARSIIIITITISYPHSCKVHLTGAYFLSRQAGRACVQGRGCQSTSQKNRLKPPLQREFNSVSGLCTCDYGIATKSTGYLDVEWLETDQWQNIVWLPLPVCRDHRNHILISGLRTWKFNYYLEAKRAAVSGSDMTEDIQILPFFFRSRWKWIRLRTSSQPPSSSGESSLNGCPRWYDLVWYQTMKRIHFNKDAFI